MEHALNITAEEAMERLKEGNERYMDTVNSPGDVSPEIMLMCGKVTHKNLIDSLHYSEKLTKKKQN